MSAETSGAHPWAVEGARRVRFGIFAGGLVDGPIVRDFGQSVEALGFDSLWLGDHPALAVTAWTRLPLLAEATRTLRLGTLVSCVYYWNPVVLARLAADVDRISGGRAVLGLGSGDLPHEFHQFGLTWPPVRERQAALEDALRIIRPLLRGESVTYQGDHFRAHGSALMPPPVQQPYVPIVVAGGGERTTLRFAAQYADASNLGAASWAGGAFTPGDARRKFEVLRRHCQEADRPYEAVLRTAVVALYLAESAPAAQAKLEGMRPWARTFLEQLPFAGTPEEAVAQLRALVDAGFRY